MILQQLLKDIEKAVRDYYLISRKYPEITIYVDTRTFMEWRKAFDFNYQLRVLWNPEPQTISGHKYHLVQNTKEPHIKFYLTKRTDGANVVLDKLLRQT